MSTITFDPHKFVKRLESTGMNAQQAEALVDIFKDAADESQVATKRDIEELRQATKTDIAEMKYDLLKWIVGLALAQFGVLIGILLKLPH